MGILSRMARAGGRATGRALSRHVVPDSLIPSWKTRKLASDGLGLLKKAARKAGKKKKKTGATARTNNRALAGIAKPSPRKPKKSFDKNGWSMGRALVGSFDESRPSRSNSRSASPARNSVSRRLQQAKDLARHPRLVAQMGLDVLKVDYDRKKKAFLSSLKGASLKNLYLR